MIVHSNGHVLGTVLVKRKTSYIKKAPSKVVFSISFHQLSQIKRASGLFAQFDQMNPVSSELFPILDFFGEKTKTTFSERPSGTHFSENFWYQISGA